MKTSLIAEWALIALVCSLLIALPGCRKEKVRQTIDETHKVLSEGADKVGSGAKKVGGAVAEGFEKTGEGINKGVKKVDEEIRE